MTHTPPIINKRELTDEIYDTLMGLAGLDDIHPIMDTDRITNQFVDARKGEISLEIDDELYIIRVSKARYNYFKEG
jgi:hypothetical protein